MVLEVPLVAVNLGTVSVESFLYVARYSKAGRGTSRMSSPVFFWTYLSFSLITGHWILTVDRSFLAFVYFKNGTLPIAFYGDLSHITEVVKTGFVSAALVVGDTLIIHRLWVVWGRNIYVCIFPMCTMLGLAICGGGITYQLSQYTVGEDIFVTAAGRWITSDTVFTLCTNVYCTALITWRIWRNSRLVAPYGSTNLNSLLGILIESAALYTTWTLFFLISYQSKSNLQFIALDCWAAVTGISCMLIHVRVGLGWSQASIHTGAASTPNAPPFAVNISRAVHSSPDHQMDDFRGRGGKFSDHV
ncbi:hypothetical protein MSAN_01482500 [Mycena sanguinolenta]|uniref:Uncharacterized protein n=1 Tax=Mycena sanguinolenta TaxID=230812 RepID=A0A8H7D1U6_9AGAR|nr:hypothetical protein MSAN_01482500 [Mycena sanguinolenta]